METNYAISIKLDALYNHENISQILKRGANFGFIYFDHKIAEVYGEGPKIDNSEAAKKVISGLKDESENGPAVYTRIENSTYAHLYFYMTDEGRINFSISVFDFPRMKGEIIDFAHYIRMLLDLCEDFSIVELKTEIF